MVELTAECLSESFKAADAVNNAFHRIVRESSGTTVISNIISGVVPLPRARRSFAEYPTEVLARSLGQHFEMIDAFEDRDPLVARTVTQAHILSASLLPRKAGSSNQ